jgi:hypothetical protein
MKTHTYTVTLNMYFFAEKNNKDVFLHDAKRITEKTYFKRVNDWFKTDLDDPEIKSLGLPHGTQLLRWKIQMVEFPKKLKLTYTTSAPLKAEDRQSYHHWIADLDGGCNRPIEFYKTAYCAAIHL